MSNCIKIDDILNILRSITDPSIALAVLSALTGDLCNPNNPPEPNGQPVSLPGGNKIDVRVVLKIQRIRKFRNQPEYQTSEEIELHDYRIANNDFTLYDVDSSSYNITNTPDPSTGMLWGYTGENRKFYFVRNSKSAILRLGSYHYIQASAWTDSIAYFVETSAATLYVNNSQIEPYPPNNDNDPPDPPDDPPPPPCDIPISSDFDLGYFCMTREEYNRFINDIDRVEENLRRF